MIKNRSIRTYPASSSRLIKIWLLFGTVFNSRRSVNTIGKILLVYHLSLRTRLALHQLSIVPWLIFSAIYGLATPTLLVQKLFIPAFVTLLYLRIIQLQLLDCTRLTDKSMIYDKLLTITRLTHVASIDIQHLSRLTRLTFLLAEVVNGVGRTVKANLLVIPHKRLIAWTMGKIEGLSPCCQISTVLRFRSRTIVPVIDFQIIFISDLRSHHYFRDHLIVNFITKFTLQGLTDQVQVSLSSI